MTTINGATNYNPSFPPRDAKKGYVAKITGRAAGALKFEREFLGDSVTLYEGDEGLYESQVGKKKGGQVRYYYAVMQHEGQLLKSRDCEDEAARIATMIDKGLSINDIVEPTEIEDGRFIVKLRTLAAARKHAANAAPATVATATAACLAAMEGMSADDKAAVIAAITG